MIRFASGAAIYEHDVVSWTAPDVTRIDEPFTGPKGASSTASWTGTAPPCCGSDAGLPASSSRWPRRRRRTCRCSASSGTWPTWNGPGPASASAVSRCPGCMTARTRPSSTPTRAGPRPTSRSSPRNATWRARRWPGHRWRMSSPAGVAARCRCAGSTHMIEEYARHNGHADLLRQRIDGATGTVDPPDLPAAQ